MERKTLDSNDGGLMLALASWRAACCLGLRPDEARMILRAQRTDDAEPAVEFKLRNCLLFVRLFRALDNIFCGNLKEGQDWLNTHNALLKETPRKLMESTNGLAMVAEYLESLLQNGQKVVH